VTLLSECHAREKGKAITAGLGSVAIAPKFSVAGQESRGPSKKKKRDKQKEENKGKYRPASHKFRERHRAKRSTDSRVNTRVAENAAWKIFFDEKRYFFKQ